MSENTVRYICPICDAEMRAGSHRCAQCRSFIRDPWRYTGGHLPNENHEDCHPMLSFLMPREESEKSPRTGNGMARTSYAKKNGISGQVRPNVPRQDTVGNNTARRSGQAASQDGRKAGEKKSGSGIFFLILFIIWLLSQFFAGF